MVELTEPTPFTTPSVATANVASATLLPTIFPAPVEPSLTIVFISLYARAAPCHFGVIDSFLQNF